MSHTNLHHRRTHNLLLISKLLGQRDAASPFTLVLDSLEQTAKPLVREYIRRANLAKTYVVFLGFETVKAPIGVDQFVQCYDKTSAQIASAVERAVAGSGSRRHHLLLIDSLHLLCTLSQQPSAPSSSTLNLTHFLSSLIAPPPPPPPSQHQQQAQTQTQNPSSRQQSIAKTTSLVAIYHTDIPLPRLSTPQSSYQPIPLSLLSYLATTLLTLHPLSALLAAKAAQDRSLAPPVYGLDEGKEGVITGLKPAKYTRHLPLDQRGVVLELEHRRKSGRGVREWYFLPNAAAAAVAASSSSGTARGAAAGFKENVTLLDDHPLFRPRKVVEGGDDIGAEPLAGMTFELGLTERQRQEREGVVLPYFDAQREGGGLGPGEGGRILYDMGAEDDFDEEEDEI